MEERFLISTGGMRPQEGIDFCYAIDEKWRAPGGLPSLVDKDAIPAAKH